MRKHLKPHVALSFRPPFRFEAIASFLGARAIAGIESYDGVRWERTGVVSVGAGSPAGTRPAKGPAATPVIIEPDGATFLNMTSPRNTDDLVRRARRTFDLDADPQIIDEHLSRDKRLRPLLKRKPGPRVPGAWEPLEVAIRAIVGQQISVRGATTIMNRLYASGRFDPSALGGMPKARMDAIRALVRAAEDDPSILERGATLEESIERLTALPGIGPWTAHYLGMRVLHETDAFPHTDLGLRKAATAIGIDPAKLLAHAERWRPWRAYAAIALWESL